MDTLRLFSQTTASSTKWSKEEEEFLKKMELQCDIYYKYNMTDYKYYHRLATKFNIPILLLSSINSLCAVVLNQFVDQKYVSIVNAVISAGTGVLGSVQLYLKINEKLSNALRSSILFKRLGMKIAKELNLDVADRGTEGAIFSSECFAEFNTAVEQGNPVEKLKMPNHLLLSTPAVDETPTASPRLRSVAQSLLNLGRQPIILRDSESPSSESMA